MGSSLALIPGLDKREGWADPSPGLRARCWLLLPVGVHSAFRGGSGAEKDDHKAAKTGDMKLCFTSIFKKVIHPWNKL